MAKVGAAAAQKKTTKTASTPAPAAPAYQVAPDYGMAPAAQQAVEASVGTALSYPATERNYYTYTMSPAQIRQQAYRMMNDRKYDNLPLVNDYELDKENARINRAQRDFLNNPRHFDPDYFYYHLTNSGWNELTKNRAEEERSMGGGRFLKGQINDIRRKNPQLSSNAVYWPTTSYGGKAVTGSFPYAGVGSYAARGFPTYEEDLLWRLANGMKY